MVWSMALAKYFVTTALLIVATSACSSGPHAPGMSVVKSSATTSGPDAILVVFPATTCTGQDSAVFIDDKGGFVGAVAPGTAAYLIFPGDGKRLFVVSSKDVTARPGAWFRRTEIAAPGGRVEHGIVVDVARIDAKTCNAASVPSPELVTFEAATHAAKSLTWLDVESEAGAKWLDEHRPRVTELLGPTPPEPTPSVVPAAPSAKTVTRAN
jgi:hypothetical protein